MHRIYGALIALGVLLGTYALTKEEKRLKLPKDTALDMVLYAVPLGIIGARLYYVLFQLKEYIKRPLSILYIWEGGLAIYGAVIGGAFGLYILHRRRKLSFLLLLDLIAPYVLLGQAIGRWGNFANREAFGYAIQNPALCFFPIGVQVEGVWHYATFFYESIWDLLGFALLMIHRKDLEKKSPGAVFFAYLFWYSAGRAVIEGLRSDSLMLGAFRVSQGLSVLLLIVSGAFFIKKGMLRWRILFFFGLALLVAQLFVPSPWLCGGGMLSCGAALLSVTTGMEENHGGS